MRYKITDLDKAWELTVSAIEQKLGHYVYDSIIGSAQGKMIISVVMHDSTIEFLNEL